MNEKNGAVKRSRDSHANTRDQQILDAACLLFFERGYQAVSIDEIGAAVGVSGPAIYRHFKGKSEVLAVLCGQTIDRLIELVGPRRADPADELTALLRGQIRLSVRYPELVRVFEDEERSLPEGLRRQVRRREREHAQRWVDALIRLRPNDSRAELEILAFAVIGMILAAPRWPRTLRTHPNFEEQLSTTALRMIDFVSTG